MIELLSASVSPTACTTIGTTVNCSSGISNTAPYTSTSGGSISLTPTASSGLSVASLAGAAVEVLAVLILLAMIGVFVIIVVANRADPDPTGRRPQSVYYFAVSFVTLAISIISSAVVVSGVLRLFGHHSGSITNSVARTLVLAGLIAVVSVVLLMSHLPRGLLLARAEGETPNPSRRVGQSYISAVAFVAVLSLLVLSVFGIYLIFALVGPGVFGSFGGRGSTLKDLTEVAYIGVIAVAVLKTHANLLSPGLTIFGKSVGAEDPNGENPVASATSAATTTSAPPDRGVQ